ncbi:hypothetical protein GLOTRDRAFT_139815 [Gloeophyllum trabeum ATCC 11539]|uniref:EF-hand domain-containing protein n=1 Tax=Gloeophyllum trabeum (strain ATCC 11539 / FP-39264 / Madison 617) TaxID=670483 RepID=S7Q284_GLOTA|nr:uncharacterized protein GLOTRDRAFT_139815 [Gloeophyllum trabeum ATCC 11539]EPQ53657.1 hypothetical protein GLOTRDRAFT_139815 [Gloeophyllum trabeum ATCC 11539]
MSSNDDYDALPASLRRKIDDAFDAFVDEDKPEDGYAEPAHYPSGDTMQAGGFILEDEPGGFIPPGTNDAGGFILDEPGGFVIDEPEQSAGGFVAEKLSAPAASSSRPRKRAKKHSHIPLSLVPQALAILDLPDDDEVLQVFRNAASGWIAPPGSAGDPPRGRGEEMVNREDWRAVCAALLGGVGEGDEAVMDVDKGEGVLEGGEEEEGDSDLTPYSEEEDEGDNESDEDFSPTKTSKTKTGRGQRPVGHSSSPSRTVTPTKRKRAPSPSDLTARQKQAVLVTFSLFFDDVRDIEQRRIGVKDIQRAARDLKEKIGLDEIQDMLQEFSPSPDYTIGLEEFGRIMIEAGLV